MYITQFVMAYSVEQDRLRAMLPSGFESIRPVLRINAEITDSKTAYIELNTAVSFEGHKKGWLNIFSCDEVCFSLEGNTVTFKTDSIEITFTKTGIKGSCPAEKDNDGCVFLMPYRVRPALIIDSQKEFCDCAFSFSGGAFGLSQGKTLPAVFQEICNVYPKKQLTLQNAASIPCVQVLGSYTVSFERI